MQNDPQKCRNKVVSFQYHMAFWSYGGKPQGGGGGKGSRVKSPHISHYPFNEKMYKA